MATVVSSNTTVVTRVVPSLVVAIVDGIKVVARGAAVVLVGLVSISKHESIGSTLGSIIVM